MDKLNLNEVTQFVENHIGDFHQRRIDKLNNIKLKEVLLHKNPYLFKAKNVNTAQDIVKGILDAFLSSSEEGIFGNWLERLAIYINDQVYRGRKAGIEGVDLDFDKDGKRYLISIKSGPHWGNASQVKKMISEFETARKRLSTSGNKSSIICVNGCSYGRSNENNEYKSNGNYYKICGQRFWELISNDPELYIKIIQPLSHEAEKRNKEFEHLYNQLINRLTKEFLNDFCLDDGSINWVKLVGFNSGQSQ
ncbi:MAG: cytosolic protein [Bacteroidales bacterium]|jgi:hypothetical protein|nr:cytosolic protein [Bacteroidales bacterium]